MDPSEFEGTIENNMFEDSPQDTMVFASMDLSKATGDIYQSIYDLQKLIQHGINVSKEEFLNEMEQLTVKITDMKEEYIQRRSNLRKVVKQYLSKLDDTTISTEFREASIEIIDLFKKEYDHVSSFAKFLEQGYLSIYNEIQNLPEYNDVLQKTFNHCLQLQDLFKQIQEQFTIAEELLSAHNAENALAVKTASANLQSSSLLANILQPRQSPTDFTPEQQQIIADEKEKALQLKEQEMKDIYVLEMLNQQKQFEQEKRTLEHHISQQYENKLLVMQQSFEKIIHSKELEITLMTNEITQWNAKKQLFEESQQILRQEQEKKSIVEDKLHQQILQNHTISQQMVKYEKELEEQKKSNEILHVQMEQVTEQFTLSKKDLESRIQSLQLQNTQQQSILDSLPNSSHMHDFAMKVGYFQANNISTDANHTQIAWTSIEQYVIEHVRKINQDIISLRIENDRLTQSQEQLQDQCGELQKKYDQLLTTTTSTATSPLSLRGGGNSGTDVFDLENILNGTITEDELLSVSRSVKDNNDHNNQQKISQILQQQRQHYKQISQQLQEEKISMQQQLASQSHDINQLQNENLELYRRLRVLRLSNNNQQHTVGSENNSSDRNNSKHHQHHQRRQVMLQGSEMDYEDGRGGRERGNQLSTSNDALDHKYSQLYEQQELNPFKILAFEKQQFYYNMHWMDRMMAWLYTTILQDPWARYAFLIYLLLLNICSLMYVFQVINPSLIEEVDARMKETWSTQTLSMPEHPDVA